MSRRTNYTQSSYTTPRTEDSDYEVIADSSFYEDKIPQKKFQTRYGSSTPMKKQLSKSIETIYDEYGNEIEINLDLPLATPQKSSLQVSQRSIPIRTPPRSRNTRKSSPISVHHEEEYSPTTSDEEKYPEDETRSPVQPSYSPVVEDSDVSEGAEFVSDEETQDEYE